MLGATLETIRRRRPVPWGQERLDAQLQRLALARRECDLFLPTDDLTIDEVRGQALAAIAKVVRLKAAVAGAAETGTARATIAKEDTR
ncbi:MAG: hypothetical protein ACYC6I_05535 [Bacillota bacterium]